MNGVGAHRLEMKYSIKDEYKTEQGMSRPRSSEDKESASTLNLDSLLVEYEEKL